PGGPGGSGTLTMAQMVGSRSTAPLAPSFDLIGFDPRGVGASRPVVRCRTDAERDAERAANLRSRTPADLAALEQETKAIVARCVQRTGKSEGIDGATFLGTIGTRE